MTTSPRLITCSETRNPTSSVMEPRIEEIKETANHDHKQSKKQRIRNQTIKQHHGIIKYQPVTHTTREIRNHQELFVTTSTVAQGSVRLVERLAQCLRLSIRSRMWQGCQRRDDNRRGRLSDWTSRS
eukprot:2905922-Rhodomonas_salina.1